MKHAILPGILSLLFATASNAQVAPSLSIEQICEEYSGFDQNHDGKVELEQLRLQALAEADAPLVLVLTEPRLLQGTPNLPSLQPQLERMLQDLKQEGRSAALVEVAFSASEEHRDGRRLLALREFLRAVSASHDLQGVVLVGRFPDAFLVRTVNWRKHEALQLHRGTEKERSWSKVRFVRRVPEAVAHRCDIVLADLDGNWEDHYIGPKLALQSIYAVFPDKIPARGGVAEDVQVGQVSFEDFFHLADGRLELAQTKVDGQSMPWVSLHDDDADREGTAADRQLPNGLAQPEIFVSRIDAHGIALSPNPAIKDQHGKSLLDASGKPQALSFSDPKQVPSWNGEIWITDAKLERELLVDYFDRNHAYRNGHAELHFRPASIACDLASGYSVLKAAAPEWSRLSEPQADLRGKPSLVDFVNWMQVPAVLRTVRAHSDPWGSVFGKAKAAELDALFSTTPRGAPLAWSPTGSKLVPSLRKAAGGGKLDFFLLRSLWNSGLLGGQSALYLHTGCHGISPPGAKTLSFDHPQYGRRAGGESLLFYGQGLAMIGRAKVFYDEPRGFAATLAEGGMIGEAWARYFAIEARSRWSKAGGDIGRKRSYFWSVLGDWTLRLQRPAP